MMILKNEMGKNNSMMAEIEKSIIVAVEAKSTLRISDVNSFVSDMKSFFDFFDEYRGRQLMSFTIRIRIFPRGQSM